VLPTTPIRLHDAAVAATMTSPCLGQNNADVNGGWLGLAADEIATLRADGVI
jgi:crotonobetainyl-CoA:carnitine CoA-transferase CaiB-like acyl-CoA transferase